MVGKYEISEDKLNYTFTLRDGLKFHDGSPVTSKDVSHGFAVYNSDNVLLFQIQAVPGTTSHIVYTFKVPGRYQVVCLEFCGVGHHDMIGSFQVAAP